MTVALGIDALVVRWLTAGDEAMTGIRVGGAPARTSCCGPDPATRRRSRRSSARWAITCSRVPARSCAIPMRPRTRCSRR